MTKDEALKLALEALEKKAGSWGVGHEALNNAAVAAIKEALAQPEQESTTDMMMALADRLGELPDDVDPRAWEHLLVYAPKRKPLTDMQKGFMVMEHLGPNALTGGKMSVFEAFQLGIDSAEAAHDIKEK